MKSHKYERILDIYSALVGGKIVNKSEYANKHRVDDRTIQRDIDDIRTFLCDAHVFGLDVRSDIIYDRTCKGYRVA